MRVGKCVPMIALCLLLCLLPTAAFAAQTGDSDKTDRKESGSQSRLSGYDRL